ncbi:MAG TPA: CidA/LrgA family protein, partial [Thalassospira lucentensis]
PAGVGVVTQIDRLKGDWLPIAAALIVSTLLAIVLTAMLMSKLLPKQTDVSTPDSAKDAS